MSPHCTAFDNGLYNRIYDIPLGGLGFVQPLEDDGIHLIPLAIWLPDHLFSSIQAALVFALTSRFKITYRLGNCKKRRCLSAAGWYPLS